MSIVSKIPYCYIISIYIYILFGIMFLEILMKEGLFVEKSNFKKFKFDYMWVTLALCFLMVAISLGLCSSGRNYYLTAITDALNIPRGAFSITNTIRFFTSTIVSLFFGKLVYKFGTKKLICAGFLFLIAFSIINALAESLYVFYLGSICLGIGLSWTGTSMVSVIINKWCKENKGTITGAVLSANGIGGAIAVQIITPIIFQEGNPFGYRTSYNMVTCVLIVMLVLIVLFFRENPKGETEKTVVAAKKRKTRGEGWVGMEYKEVIKKPYFYLTLVCVLFTGMALQGMGGVSLPHMYDLGIDVNYIALISSFGSILLMFSKFGTGIMYDRLGMRLTVNIGYLCTWISLIGLIILKNDTLGRVIMVLRAIFGCFATPLETVMIPLIANELFGNKDFEKVVGVFVAVNYAGFALGSPLGNLCYDLLGSYNLSFLIFSFMMIFVTIAMQFVIKSAKRDRKAIESALV